jgi:hypothetical protein
MQQIVALRGFRFPVAILNFMTGSRERETRDQQRRQQAASSRKGCHIHNSSRLRAGKFSNDSRRNLNDSTYARINQYTVNPYIEKHSHRPGCFRAHWNTTTAAWT